MKDFSFARGVRFLNLTLFMGMGAMAAGVAYSAIYEKLVGKPLNH